jgi:hypothetical protein
MTDNQPLSEILIEALNDIAEAGGRDRHLLRQTIGKPAFDALISKPKGSDLVDRWLNASDKAKPAATRALSVFIARVADKPDLVDRITNEIGDAFEIPTKKSTKVGPSLEPGEREPIQTAEEKQANPVNFKIVADSHIRKKDRNGQKPKADIATIAKSDDMKKYYAVRQRLQKSEL